MTGKISKAKLNRAAKDVRRKAVLRTQNKLIVDNICRADDAQNVESDCPSDSEVTKGDCSTIEKYSPTGADAILLPK